MCENACQRRAEVEYEGEALCADCAIGYELAVQKAAETMGERRARLWAREGLPI